MRADYYFEERVGASPRVSKSLVSLSSAAVVAIYTAGYYRTNPAAHRFDSQREQRTAAAITAVAGVTAPPQTNPATNAAGSGPSAATPAPAVKKNAAPPASSARKSTESAESRAKPAAPPSGEKAKTEAEAANPPAASAQPQYKDGLFLGWGSCPHGDIEASVLIQGGKIASAAISQCLTRYSCSWISPRVPSPVLPDLPRQVVERQSAKVDYVSGATESSYAFADAITAALSKASE